MATKLHQRCSECPHTLKGRPAGTKTCSIKCKSARARRIKRSKEAAGQNSVLPEGMADVSAVVTKGAKDVAHEVLRDELRPIVREALTEDVLHGINTMVGLTPRAIELLQKQMESRDETISQRAVTLLLKYTMGNPSVAPPPTTPAAGGLTVVLGMPRPGDAIGSEVAAQDPSDAEELRACGDCGEDKLECEFVAGSQRCRTCFGDMRGMLKDRFGDAYDG